MSNRIVNKYGATKWVGAAKEALDVLGEYEFSVRQIIQKHKLTPVEIRCLESALKPCVFAEETLRTAMNMKKAERN